MILSFWFLHSQLTQLHFSRPLHPQTCDLNSEQWIGFWLVLWWHVFSLDVTFYLWFDDMYLGLIWPTTCNLMTVLSLDLTFMTDWVSSIDKILINKIRRGRLTSPFVLRAVAEGSGHVGACIGAVWETRSEAGQPSHRWLEQRHAAAVESSHPRARHCGVYWLEVTHPRSEESTVSEKGV